MDEIDNDKDVEKSDTEIEKYESIEETKDTQQEKDRGINILDDANKKETSDPRMPAMFKRSRHINLSTFIISNDYYELLNELNELLGKPITFLDQKGSEMFRISIETKQPWTRPLKKLSY